MLLRASLIVLFAVAAQSTIRFPICSESSQLICDGVTQPLAADKLDVTKYAGLSLTTPGTIELPGYLTFQCIGEKLHCSSTTQVNNASVITPIDCNTDTFAPLYKCRCAPVSSAWVCGSEGKSLPFCVESDVYCSDNTALLGTPITSASKITTGTCPPVKASTTADLSDALLTFDSDSAKAPFCVPISNNGLVVQPGALGASTGGKRACSLLDFSYTINGVDNSRVVSEVSFDYKCPSTGNKWRNFKAVRDGHNWSAACEGFFGLFGKPCFLRRENTAVEVMLKATVDTGAVEVAEAALTSSDGSEVTTLKFLCTQSIFN